MAARTLSLFLMAGAIVATYAMVATYHDGSRPAAPPVKARLDLHGDPLPVGAIARMGTVRWRARQVILRMAFVPGDRYLVTGGGEALSVWDLGTGRVVRTTGDTFTPLENDFDREFVFTPDGKRILSCGGIWDKTRGLWGDLTPNLLLWDFASGQLLARSPNFPGEPIRLAIRRDGRLAACIILGGDVLLWEPDRKSLRRVLRRQDIGVGDLAFTRDGKRLIVMSRDWLQIDVTTGEEVRQVTLGARGRGAIAAADGTVGMYDYPDQLCLYDPDTGKKRRLALKEKVNNLDLSFSPDGRTLLATDRQAEIVQFWDVAKGQLLRRLRLPGLVRTHEAARLLLSGDGKTLASHERSLVVRLWDAATGQPRLHFPGHVNPSRRLAFSSGGKEIVSHGPEDTSRGGVLYRWEVATGRLLSRVLLATPDEDSPVAEERWLLSPQGRNLALADLQHVYLHDTRTGKRVLVRSPDSIMTPLTFTPDGRTLVTPGPDHSLRWWDARTGKLLRWQTLGKKIEEILWICFTPDGRTLATGEGDWKVHLWNASTGAHRATLLLPDKRKSDREALVGWRTTFSPDGRYLILSSLMELWVWDVQARREIGPFQTDQHRGGVGGVYSGGGVG
jgi:WD40 repeat protein